MRILMLSNDYPPVTGGIATHIKYLSEHLVQTGIAVDLLVPTPGQPGKLLSKANEGVLIHRVGYRHTSIAALRALRITHRTMWGFNQLKARGQTFDLIQQHDVRATKIAAMLLAHRSGLPMVWTCHSPHMWAGKSWQDRLFMRLLLNRQNGVITVSHKMKQHIEELAGEDKLNIQFISNGVDTSQFHPSATPLEPLPGGLSGNDFIVLCPSRQVPVKGTLHLAKALRELFREDSQTEIKAIFLEESSSPAKENDYLQSIKNVLKEQLGHRVFFMDHLPIQQMPNLYAVADLVVLTSLHDAVNLSMLESWAMAKPLIATRVGGIAETVTHGQSGILVPPGSPVALREAVLRLYENRELRAKLATSSFAAINSGYQWTSIARQTRSFYEQVLDRQHHPAHFQKKTA